MKEIFFACLAKCSSVIATAAAQASRTSLYGARRSPHGKRLELSCSFLQVTEVIQAAHGPLRTASVTNKNTRKLALPALNYRKIRGPLLYRSPRDPLLRKLNPTLEPPLALFIGVGVALE